MPDGGRWDSLPLQVRPCSRLTTNSRSDSIIYPTGDIFVVLFNIENTFQAALQYSRLRLKTIRYSNGDILLCQKYHVLHTVSLQ